MKVIKLNTWQLALFLFCNGFWFSANAGEALPYSWSSPAATFHIGDLPSMAYQNAFLDATQIWNDTPSQFEISTINDSGIGYCTEEGNSSTRFSDSICDDQWGENTIGIALTWFSYDAINKVDIIFNNNVNWGIYDGPLQQNTEFRRVAVHEIGHAIGLGHSSVPNSIMAPFVNDFYVPQIDDIQTLLGIYDQTVPLAPDVLYNFLGGEGEQLGYSVSAAGDVNGDGYDDIIAGAPSADVNGNDSGSATVFSGFDGSVVYSFNGEESLDSFGNSVGGIGDVNNDGYDDFIIGIFGDNSNGSASGSVQVRGGIDGNVLYILNGVAAGNNFGQSVSEAGDVNNDGVPDFIVASKHRNEIGNNGYNSGSARVYSGLNGSLLYTFDGENTNDRFAGAVSGAGDVNGDGFADIIIGAVTASEYGQTTVFSGQDGSILYVFNGDSTLQNFGHSVAGAGDVNNDGYDDLIIGVRIDSTLATSAGSARVYSGADGQELYAFYGEGPREYFGSSVDGVGDVNNDGFADLIVSAKEDNDSGWVDGGKVVIYNGFDGEVLYTFSGESHRDYLGFSVGAAGDINNDGYSDFIVGAHGMDHNGADSGSVFVFSGKSASISEISFTDAAMQSCVSNVASNHHWLAVSQMTSLFCPGAGISSLTGINELTALTSINLNGNLLNTVNLIGLTELESLLLNSNTISNINLEANTELELLELWGNQLTEINLNRNIALSYLDLGNNSLSLLSLTNNTALTEVYLDENSLASIDLNNNILLESLSLKSNLLRSIDVTNNTALEFLELWDNQLPSINLSQNILLEYLDLDENQLTEIDLSQNHALSYLYLNHNFLTSLDISNNTNLFDLQIVDNPLNHSTVLYLDSINGVDGLSVTFDETLLNISREDIDFNGDNLSDLLLRKESVGVWYMYLLDGTNVVEKGRVAGASRNLNWEFQGLGDFNGNGQTDLLIRHKNTGSWYVYYLDGREVVNTERLRASGNISWQYQALEDFNGDGSVDLLVRHSNTGAWKVYYLDGNRVLGSYRVSAPRNASWEFVGLEDFDGNGSHDLLLRHSATGAWSTYFLDGVEAVGRTRLQAKRNLAWEFMGLDDLNGDGNVDLLIRKSDTGAWYVHYLDGEGGVLEGGSLAAKRRLTWHYQMLQDLNNDGESDLLVRNSSTGVWFVYYLNSGSITGRGRFSVISRNRDFQIRH